MAAKKICPSCNKEIIAAATKCPECQKELEILCWEVEPESGQRVSYTGKSAEPSIREDLIAGKLKLTNRCRQYTNVLERIEAGKDHYRQEKETEWKTLQEYANGVFSLQALYDPVKAYGKRVAQITWATVGAIVAIVWNMDFLLALGVHPVVAFLISLIFIPLAVTVIGLIIGSYVVGLIYGPAALGIGTRTFWAIVIGVLIGGIVGWTIGYLIGVAIGSTKKKLVQA